MPANEHEKKQRSEIPANMVSEFASYCSPSRMPVLVRGMQALSEAGLPIEDIADAVYSSSRVFDALKEGDYEAAKQLAFAGLKDNVAQLRSCGVPEDRLRVLSESGLAVGEIAYAIRTIRGLREELLDSDSEKAKQWAAVLHEFFRKGGRPTHSAQPEHSQADDRRSAASTEESWFERYSKLMQTAQDSIQSRKPESTEDEQKKDEQKKTCWYDGVAYQTEAEAVQAELFKIRQAPHESIQQAARKREKAEADAVVWRWILTILLVLLVIWLVAHYAGDCNPDSLYGC